MAKNNPWLALSTYDETDEYRLKGRNRDKEQVLAMLQQQEYLTIYAASGDGKSSLINAGLCPEMRRLGYFPIKINMPDDSVSISESGKIDFDTLLLKQIEDEIKKRERYLCEKYNGQNFHIEFEKVEDYGKDEVLDRKLWWKLRTETIQIPFGEYDYTPVLIFDQFEEVFRTKYKFEFFKWLESLSKDICPDEINSFAQENSISVPTHKRYKIIFSMRYEYVGELDYYCSQRCFIPQMMRGRYFLKPLNSEQALSVITEQQSGDPQALDLIRGNAEKIIRELGKHNRSANTEISAILLSILCYVYYNSIVDNGITDLPDTKDLVSSFYKSKLSELNLTGADIADFEDKLVTKEGTRKRSVFLNDIPSLTKKVNVRSGSDGKKNTLQIWEVLKEEHLLYVEQKEGVRYVEFVHDKLAEAANDERTLRSKRKKADYVKLLIGILGVCLFFGAFVIKAYTKKHFENVVTVSEVNPYAEYHIIDADSQGVLNSAALKKIRLESKTGWIAFNFGGQLPNLEEIELCDTLLYNNYSWENGILWHFKNDSNREEMVFSSDKAPKILTNVAKRKYYYHYYDKIGHAVSFANPFYNKAYYEEKKDSFLNACLVCESTILTKLKDKSYFVDTLDLSKYNNIRIIGNYAFENCDFTCVILPDSLTKICSYAFKDCKRLKNVVLGKELRQIGTCAFYRCDSILEIVLQDSCFVADCAFYDCQGLRAIRSKNALSEVCFVQKDTVRMVCEDMGLDSVIVRTSADYPDNKAYGIRGAYVDVRYADNNRKLFVVSHVADSLKYKEETSIIPYKSLRGLTDIYILSPEIGVGYHGLDKINRSQITLHVPYGTMDVMQSVCGEWGFRNIEEMSLIENSYYIFVETMRGVLYWILHNMILSLGFVLLILLPFVILKKKKKVIVGDFMSRYTTISTKQIVYSILLFAIYWLAGYWFVWLEVESWGRSMLYGIFLGVSVAAISLKSDWIQDNFVRIAREVNNYGAAKIKQYRHYILFALSVAIVLLLIGRWYSRYSESLCGQIKQLVKDGDITTAAALMNDGLLLADTSLLENKFIEIPLGKVECQKVRELYHNIGDVAFDAKGRFLYIYSYEDSVVTKWDVDNKQLMDTMHLLHSTKPKGKDVGFWYKGKHEFMEIRGENIKTREYCFVEHISMYQWIGDSAIGIITKDLNAYVFDVMTADTLFSCNLQKYLQDIYRPDFRLYSLVKFNHNKISVRNRDKMHIIGYDGQEKEIRIPIGYKLSKADDSCLALASGDSLFIYDEEYNLRTKMEFHCAETVSLRLCESGDRFAIYGKESVVIYELKTGNEVSCLENDDIDQIVDNGTNNPYVLSTRRKVYQIDFSKGSLREESELSRLSPNFVSTYKDEVYAINHGKLYCSHKNSISPIRTGLKEYDDTFCQLQKSPQGDSYVSVLHGSRNKIYIWNRTLSQIVDSMVLTDRGTVDNVSYSPNGKYIMAKRYASTYVYDLENKSETRFDEYAEFTMDDKIFLFNRWDAYIKVGTDTINIRETNSYLSEVVANRKAPWILDKHYDRVDVYCYQNLKLKKIGKVDVGSHIVELLFLTENTYCVRTADAIYLYTIDGKEFVNRYHIPKEQRQRFGIPIWIYYLNRMLSLFC